MDPSGLDPVGEKNAVIPFDVFSSILSFLQQPADLARMALVSSQLQDLSERRLYRCVGVYALEQAMSFLLSIGSTIRLGSYIRSLTLRMDTSRQFDDDSDQESGQEGALIDMLKLAFRRMDGLIHLEYACAHDGDVGHPFSHRPLNALSCPEPLRSFIGVFTYPVSAPLQSFLIRHRLIQHLVLHADDWYNAPRKMKVDHWSLSLGPKPLPQLRSIRAPCEVVEALVPGCCVTHVQLPCCAPQSLLHGLRLSPRPPTAFRFWHLEDCALNALAPLGQGVIASLETLGNVIVEVGEVGSYDRYPSPPFP